MGNVSWWINLRSIVISTTYSQSSVRTITSFDEIGDKFALWNIIFCQSFKFIERYNYSFFFNGNMQIDSGVVYIDRKVSQTLEF